MTDIAIDSNLLGESSLNLATTVAYSLSTFLSGSSNILGTPKSSLKVNSTLNGSSTQQIPNLVIGLTANLANSSSVSSPSFQTHFRVNSTLGGFSSIYGWESWSPSPGAPISTPSINSAVTLQQFIDALGVSKPTPKFNPTHSTSVDTRPVKRPYTPR